MICDMMCMTENEICDIVLNLQYYDENTTKHKRTQNVTENNHHLLTIFSMNV